VKALSSACVLLLLAGCSWLNLKGHNPQPQPQLAHSYLSFPMYEGEVKNLNPNSRGDPWMAGGLVLPTDEELLLAPMVSMGSQGRSSLPGLPTLVDNSTKKYFRGIFAQKHGSCAQASGIAYVYGYEVNRMRDVSANTAENKFPTHWTYNFVNNGYDRGSWMMWGWEVGKSLGIPTAKAYGTETGFDLKYWPSKYEVYESAIDNKVEKYFIMQVGTKAGLESVKRFIWNHGAEGRDGGILSFAAGWSTGYAEATIPAGQYGAGKKLIKSFGKSVNHAVTFVGYDDNICYDFNGDKKCSNDKDLNGDGKIDLKDWEVGAFIMANSWGTGWGDKGFIYVPYRLGALDPSDGGIYRQYVFGVVPARDEDKELVLKVEMQHDKRNQLKVISSYRKNDGNGGDRSYQYYGLANSGGAFPLNGKDNDPVTFGLDLRTLLKTENLKKALDIGAVVESLGGGSGEMLKVSVVDYVNETETFADEGTKIEKGRNMVQLVWDPDGDDDPEPDPEPDPDPEPPKPCQIGPVARAGLNMTVGEYCALVLDGSKSFDVDGGEIVKYQWRQVSGPQKLKIENAAAARALVLIPTVKRDEKYEFELSVTDNNGYSSVDRARVLVKDRFQEE
jgi:hypothetical protein